MENPSSRQEQHKVDQVGTPLANRKEPQGLSRLCLLYFGSMLEKYGDFFNFLKKIPQNVMTVQVCLLLSILHKWATWTN